MKSGQIRQMARQAVDNLISAVEAGKSEQIKKVFRRSTCIFLTAGTLPISPMLTVGHNCMKLSYVATSEHECGEGLGQ